LIFELYQELFDIRAGTDREGTISSIKSELPLRGANIWYLICSAIIASIGLNVNSPAIIIGAMLKSPLMSPILEAGTGYIKRNEGKLYDYRKSRINADILVIINQRQ